MAADVDKGDTISAYEVVALRDLLDRMEPQLGLLEGMVTILQALAETADSVEPIAFAAMAHLGRGSLTEISTCWRDARNLLSREDSNDVENDG